MRSEQVEAEGRSRGGARRTIESWLEAVEDPDPHEVEFAIDVLESEMRGGELQMSISLSFAAIALALVTVCFALGAPLLGVFSLIPVAMAIATSIAGSVSNRRSLRLLWRLYRLRHRPKPSPWWRFWAKAPGRGRSTSRRKVSAS